MSSAGDHHEISHHNLPDARCRAYVTFLAGNGDYVKGVVGLAKGLRRAESAYPLVVAVLPDVPEDHRRILRSQGCIVREIEPVYPPPNHTNFAMAYYVINYSKLRIWAFEEYEKMVYLDGDIQVFENIDHLFESAEDGFLYAVMDCFCEKTWSHSPQYAIGYCQQCPDKLRWPAEELGPPPPLYFNAGMLVFRPSLVTYSNLLDALQLAPPTAFAEQDFLNMFFKDVYKPIPNVYNLVLAMLWRHPENVDLDKVKVVHYCAAGSKPWRYTGEEENMDRQDIKKLVKKWWDIYEDESLDYANYQKVNPNNDNVNSINNNNNDNAVVRKKNEEEEHDQEKQAHVKLGPFVTALAETGLHQLSAPSAA